MAASLSIGVAAHPFFNGQLISRADKLLTEYDYVVVGAGPGGLTVANRLSELASVNVLIIEAGNFDQNEDIITIPSLAAGVVGTKYDWNISYAAEEGLGGRRTSIPLGKVVGGSTKLNRMVWDRGSRSDYDGWEELGNKGWNFNTLLPYFKKSETFTPPTAEIQAEYNIEVNMDFHGVNGPIQVTRPPFIWETTKNLLTAVKSLGIPINDQATGNAIGGYFIPRNIDKNMSRSSAEETYYASAVKRSNFHLLSGHQVTRIITSKAGGTLKVTGIEFAASASAAKQSVKVKQEAIIAAGAIHTPQLLQVSGIGDDALLKSINVETVVNLPAVGHNFHDHISTFQVSSITTTLFTASSLSANATLLAQARQQYDSERKGPMTNPNGDILLFLPVSTFTNATSAILSQAQAGGAAASLPSDTPPEVAKGYAAQYALLNKKIEAEDSAFGEILWVDGFNMFVHQHPYSRGYVKAVSANIFDTPNAKPGFLRNPVDVAVLREGFRFLRKLSGAPGINELQPFELSPGANITSDKDIDNYILGNAGAFNHPAGSCKMGRREDGGVVDGKLRVHGVQGLRIADASVIPILPASHIAATVYAIAERAADFIKGSKAYKTR